jgi:hypothetical protein
MKASVLALVGIVVGCAAGAVGLAPTPTRAQIAAPVAIMQYCTDTGDFNDTGALDRLVRQAGKEGWELIGVYRPSAVGATHLDYVCFRRPRS